jgi:hypothetical protein
MRRILDFFSKDPSKNWVRSSLMQLTFHLASASLNGVAIDDPFEKISIFGRPSNRNPFRQEWFDYPDLGLEIGGENNRIKYFSFMIQAFFKDETACNLTLISERGTPLLLTNDTKLEELKKLLGEPFESEDFGEEVAYRFKYRHLILEFEFDETGLLYFEAGLENYV